MPSSRRLFSILDSSPSEFLDKADSATSSPSDLAPPRGKPKLSRLTALLFGSKRSKFSQCASRGSASLDICLNSSEQCRQDTPTVASGTLLSATGASGNNLTAPSRRSESRILAFLTSRLSDGSAMPPSRLPPDGDSSSSTPSAAAVPQQQPPSQPGPARAASSGSSSSGGAPLCVVAISAPDLTSPTAPEGSPAKPRVTANPSSIQFLDLATPRESASGRGPLTYLDSSVEPDAATPPRRPGPVAAAVTVGGSPTAAAAAPRAVTTLRERVVGGANAAASAAAAAASAAAVAAAAAEAAAAAAAFSPPRPQTQLLVSHSAAPEAMRRACWSLEDYAVDRRLYRSATASVYSAVCLRSGVRVALKIYNLTRVPTNVVHMLVREIKVQSTLVHKNIVKLYGAFHDTSSQRLVLVQEFAANGDLLGVHRALHCRLTEAQARALVLRPLLEAVAHCHSLGIVHRDIKPDNILFGPDWQLLLGDFGVAIDSTAERAVTRAGTVGYMAPEVERCPLKMLPEDNKSDPSIGYTTAADIWGIGCLAYLLLLGFPPFVMGYNGLNDQNRNHNHHANRPAPADGGSGRALVFPSSTSQLARDFIGQALAERPEERPTALQLLQHPWLAAAVQQQAQQEQPQQVQQH